MRSNISPRHVNQMLKPHDLPDESMNASDISSVEEKCLNAFQKAEKDYLKGKLRDLSIQLDKLDSSTS